MTEPELHDLEARALWHLELVPEDMAPPDPGYCAIQEDAFDDGWDEDADFACTHCGGEGYAQVDDPLWDECDEYGYGPCASCHGTGQRRHQWVF